MLAAGWRGCCWLVTCDQDFKRDVLKSPNVTAAQCCGNCPANTTSVPWYHFRHDAEWCQRIYTVAEWRQSGWNQVELFDTDGITNHSTCWSHAHTHIHRREKYLWQTLTFICLRVDPSMLAPPHNQGSCRFFWRQSFAVALETRGQEGLVLCIVDNDLPPKAHGSDRFLRGVPRGRPHTHKHTHTHTHTLEVIGS